MIIRRVTPSDTRFLLWMARLASTLEGRPIPSGNDPEVTAVLPADDDIALVAAEDDDRPLGAIWCHQHEPALLQDKSGRALPEMIVAVCPEDRNQGVGTQLIEELVDAMRPQTAAVVLNVHLLNPAVRLYIRAGFCVTGRGRGIYGVAMTRLLS